MAFEHLQNNVAEQRPFGIYFEPTVTGDAACKGRLIAANSASEPTDTFEIIMLYSSSFCGPFQRLEEKA